MLIAVPEPVADLFCRAYRAGLQWKDVLDRAEVSRTTWWRFETRRISPRIDQLEKVERAIDELIAAHAPDPAAFDAESV